MMKRIDHEGRFVAKDDAGNEYKINIYVQILDASNYKDKNEEVRGLKSMKTDDGYDVIRISKGEYEIVKTGLHLQSSDPNSP